MIKRQAIQCGHGRFINVLGTLVCYILLLCHLQHTSSTSWSKLLLNCSVTRLVENVRRTCLLSFKDISPKLHMILSLSFYWPECRYMAKSSCKGGQEIQYLFWVLISPIKIYGYATEKERMRNYWRMSINLCDIF